MNAIATQASNAIRREAARAGQDNPLLELRLLNEANRCEGDATVAGLTELEQVLLHASVLASRVDEYETCEAVLGLHEVILERRRRRQRSATCA
jgi:hypothetical protein